MKRVTKITGAVVAVGAGIAAVAWMVRDRLARPRTAPEPVAPAPFRVAPPVATPDTADDLSVIRGIGPVFSARLATAGIARFDALAAAAPSTVAAAAGVPEGRAREWIDQARLLV